MDLLIYIHNLSLNHGISILAFWTLRFRLAFIIIPQQMLKEFIPSGQKWKQTPKAAYLRIKKLVDISRP